MEIASGDACCNHKCTGLNAVADDFVVNRTQFFDTLDDQPRRADAGDFGAHLVEKVRQVADFRLTGRRFDDGGALG
jgi:hypothetical protein